MRRPSMKDLATALPEALVRYAAIIPPETRQALTRAVTASPDVPEAERPEFVQRYMAGAMINGIGRMVEASWLASHGNFATESERERRRSINADLEKLRSSPEWFGAVIEPMRSVDPSALSGAWAGLRERIEAAFSLGMEMSERVMGERAREENRRKASAQTATLMKAIEEVCKARKRKVSATKQCAGEIRKDVKKWLIKYVSDLESTVAPLDKTARKIKALLNGRTWPSESKILGTINKFKAAEKAGIPFL